MNPSTPEPITPAKWDSMAPEEQDALIASGWHPGPAKASLLFDAIRHSLNQLTDHGSQKCLDCVQHRQVGMDAVDDLERLYKQTVTKQDHPPHNKERPRDVGAPGAAT